MYVYIQTEANLFTVGFYDPEGEWIPEKDCESRDEAAKRVAFLNGGVIFDEKDLDKNAA